MRMKPLKIYLFCLMLTGILCLPAGYGYAQPISVIVLPFENKTLSLEQNWMGEGLALSLADKISHIQDTFVTDRHALQQSLMSGVISKLTAASIEEAKGVGQKFESRYVIWGYYTLSSEVSVFIHVTDITPAGKTIHWDVKFDPKDILNVQPEILKDVLFVLGVKLDENKEAVILAPDTNNLETYKSYISAYLIFMNEQADTALGILKPILKLNPYYGPAVALSIKINEETNRGEELPALYQKYVEILSVQDDLQGLDLLYDKITDLYVNDKKYNAALEYYRKKLDLVQRKGDLRALVQTYIKIANTCSEMKEQENAITNYNKALDIQKKLGDQAGMANTYQDMADVYLAKGLDVTAVKHYQKALEIWRLLNHKDEMGVAYSKIGQAYLVRQDYKTAQKYLTMAVEIQQSSNNTSQTQLGDIYNSLGNLYLMQLDYDKAMDYFQKALNIQERANNLPEMISTYENMATIYMRRKQLDKAVVIYQRELKIQMDLEQRKQVAATYSKLGQIAYEKQNYDSALEYFDKARGFLQIAGGGHELDDMYITVGHTYKAKQDFDQALKNYQKYLEGQRLKNDEFGQMDAYYHISTVYDSLGQPEKAVNYLERAVTLAKISGSTKLVNYQTYLNQLKQKAEAQPASSPQPASPVAGTAEAASPKSPEQPVKTEPEKSSPPAL